MKVRVIWKPGGLLGHHRVEEADAPPQALVDVHSHILWGLDDGPSDLNQSLAMLQVAAEHGTTDIVATPRASFEYRFDPRIVAQRLEELRARSDGAIRIHAGCAFHFGFDNIRDALANPHKYTINGLNFLLVEFPDLLVPPGAEKILDNFRKQGLVPVISQPERNSMLQHSMERMQAWVSMGCMVQVTARSLSGHFGKIEQRCAWDLLRTGTAHLIASGARDLLYNPPRLDAAWRLVKRELGEDAAQKLLIDNPSAVVHGRALGRKPVAQFTLDRRAVSGS